MLGGKAVRLWSLCLPVFGGLRDAFGPCPSGLLGSPRGLLGSTGAFLACVVVVLVAVIGRRGGPRVWSTS